MPALPQTPDRFIQLESLTRDYARYSRSAGGLAAVLGGVLCLIAYLLGGLVTLTPSLRIGLVLIPFCWLFAKQLLVRHYYQRFGRVEERLTRTEAWSHRGCTAFTALVCLAIVIGVASMVEPIGDKPLTAGIIGYLLVVMALPYIVWRWLRGTYDFIIGTFLFCQAAVVMSGGNYPLLSVGLMFAVVALMMIWVGVRDHRHFLRIAAQLSAIRRDAVSGA